VFLAVQTLTPLFSLTVPNFVVFFGLLDRKFYGDSKNLLKTVIFSLKVGLTSNFVPDCYTVKLYSKVAKIGFRSFLVVQKVFLRFMTVILTLVT